MTDLTPDPARTRSTADLGRELALARERAGLTIRGVARRTRLLPGTLGGSYTGRHRPHLGHPRPARAAGPAVLTDPEEAVAAICGAVGASIATAKWARHVPDLPLTPPC